MQHWTYESAMEIYHSPFFHLIHRAHEIHIQNFDPQKIQVSSLHSIQTGGCAQDCAYCAQSIKNGTKMPKQEMSDLQTVIEAAKIAKSHGSSRFCMGASGKKPDSTTFDDICEMIQEVKKIGLETCVTLGCLTIEQAKQLKEAGLDYYNHNIDTSKEYYSKIITTRTIEDRLETLKIVSDQKINICCGGIVGMGETIEDRIKMLLILNDLPITPKSIPINRLVKIPGTQLENAENIDDFEIIRLIALTRIMMQKSYIRLSAGRETMSETMQAMCFYSGANSVFAGDKLLTVSNTPFHQDDEFFHKINIKKE